MRRRRSPARWLAPLAILACGFAVYSVVNTGLRSDDSAAERPTTTAGRSGTSKTRTVSERRAPASGRRARTYIVKAGDTLSSIATRNGMSLAGLQALNPELDSQSLQTGQRVKLTP
jgi:LysM repeat protein